MEERFQHHPDEVKHMTTEQVRNAFAITNLMSGQAFKFIYTHYDRMIVGGLVSGTEPIILETYQELKSAFFLERRELGIININGSGIVSADGEEYVLDKLDCLYLGRGTKDVRFRSKEKDNPAHFFLLSAPAHRSYPNELKKNKEAIATELGSPQTANERTIYKYIHEEGIKSCQLVMGLTILKQGSVWNTMPAHTHNRRMEVYLYFDLPSEQRVFHFMGQPQETRHIVIANNEAIVSPPWSIHSGCGTTSYSFIWGMAGENQSFADMDFVEIRDIL